MTIFGGFDFVDPEIKKEARMLSRQKRLKIKLIKEDISLEDFYNKFIREAGISFARFRNMYYNNQKITEEVDQVIEKYLETE